jgi:DNA-binding XRE family transcriptional regulator
MDSENVGQEKTERFSEMHGVQSKMARAALGLTIHQLAGAAGVSHDTIVRLEAGQDLKPKTVEKVKLALEKAGVELTNGDAPGVRLRPRRRS